MKKLSAFLLLIIIFFGCKRTDGQVSEKESFSISGTIDGDYADFIFLGYGKTKDSVQVVNNRFLFKGSVERPTQAWLNLRPDATIAWVYIENSEIEIKAEYEKKIQKGKSLNILKITHIQGSRSADIQKEYREFCQENKIKENFQNLLFTKLDTFFQKNRTHPLCGTILADLATVNPVLSNEELTHLYAKLDTTMQNTEDLQMFKDGISKLAEYGVGKSFLKFKLPDLENKEIDIESYLGKIILIDFWASWCAPCRAKHPDLIKLKNRIKNDRFDIVSISVDDSKEKWINAVKKDNLFWTNLIDIEMRVNNELGILAIPANYLIDGNGIVLGVNLSIEQIEGTVLNSLKE